MKAISALTILVLLLIVGCGRKATMLDMPAMPPVGHYELTWANPEYVYTDTLVTLIRAEKVDSFYVGEAQTLTPEVPSIRFEVRLPDCNVAISVFNEYSRLATPILVKQLPTGYYRLTLEPDRLSRRFSLSGSASLRADVCGESVIQPIVVPRQSGS